MIKSLLDNAPNQVVRDIYISFFFKIGNTPEAQSDAVFEAANLLMNLAFWHMKHSAMLAVKPDLDMEEAKKVHTSLRKAAGKNYDLTQLTSN